MSNCSSFSLFVTVSALVYRIDKLAPTLSQ